LSALAITSPFPLTLVLVLKTHEGNLIGLLEQAGYSRDQWEKTKADELSGVRARYIGLLVASPAAPG
jgi:hypothetical protein